jgi:hypothetical protein
MDRWMDGKMGNHHLCYTQEITALSQTGRLEKYVFLPGKEVDKY